MPITSRTLTASGIQAEGDKVFAQFIYNDTSNALVYGMPVYLDLSDASEFNSRSTLTAITPAKVATAGTVVLGTNAQKGQVIGVYQDNPAGLNSKVQKGDVIRVLIYGRGIVATEVKTAGTAATVGAYLVGDATQNRALVGAAALRNTIGQIVATAAALVSGNSIIAVPGSGVTDGYVNAFVDTY